MSKEILADGFTKNDLKCCPVTGLPVLSLQGFANIQIKGDHYISLLKIGESIVYISGKGNLKNYDVEKFNKVLDDFCKAAQVSKPYLQIRETTHLSGRIPLNMMQQQGRYFFKEQDSFLGVIAINEPSWMNLFVRYGVRLFSIKTRFIPAKDYTEALQQAQQLLSGGKTTHLEKAPLPLSRGFRFEDVQFDPQWVYQNHQTNFSYKMGVVPGRILFSTICGAMETMEDVKQTIALINKVSHTYHLIGKLFIVVDLTRMSGRSSIFIQKAFAREIKKLWNSPGEFESIHVVISPNNVYRIAGKLFFSLMGQQVITAATVDEAFEKMNGSLYSGAKSTKSDNSIMVSKSDLDEIFHACSYLLLDEKADAPPIGVSPDNPLFEIAQMLELVKTDLNEQRQTAQRNNEERLKESDKNRRQLLSIMEDNEAAKKALLKTKAEMSAIIENTLDNIWSVNKNYEIIYINEACAKAYKASYGVTLSPGSNVLDAAPRDIRSLWEERYDRVLNGERWIIVDKDDAHGTFMHVEIAAHPIYNNDRVVGASLFARNITERMLAEETRQQLEVVKNTIQIKQNFLANMSHEIRTPLTGILGMAELLEQTKLSEEQKDFVTTMKVSGENLTEIINQVLDFSKIEAGKVNLKPSVFEFASLILETENIFKNIVSKSVELRTNIDPSIPPYIFADKSRIAQILNNLTSNAVKFTSGGSVSINTQLVPSSNPGIDVVIKIEVSDTGKGIPWEKQDKLFVPFSQIEDNDRRDYEGTGLGLTICKELIHLMGGEIGLESQTGKGSTFWFTFPAAIAQNTPQEDTSSDESSHDHKLNILLVEDKLVNQKVIDLMLTSLNHKVTMVANGEQAIDIFEPSKFNLILMDIQMPIMDGITATQLLRDKFKELPPIIGLSANAFEGDREKYMALGMDEYLTKPVKKDDFEKLISTLIPKAQQKS